MRAAKKWPTFFTATVKGELQCQEVFTLFQGWIDFLAANRRNHAATAEQYEVHPRVCFGEDCSFFELFKIDLDEENLSKRQKAPNHGYRS